MKKLILATLCSVLYFIKTTSGTYFFCYNCVFKNNYERELSLTAFFRNFIKMFKL